MQTTVHAAVGAGHTAISLWPPLSWATHPKIQGQLSRSLSHSHSHYGGQGEKFYTTFLINGGRGKQQRKSTRYPADLRTFNAALRLPLHGYWLVHKSVYICVLFFKPDFPKTAPKTIRNEHRGRRIATDDSPLGVSHKSCFCRFPGRRHRCGALLALFVNVKVP